MRKRLTFVLHAITFQRNGIGRSSAYPFARPITADLRVLPKKPWGQVVSKRRISPAIWVQRDLEETETSFYFCGEIFLKNPTQHTRLAGDMRIHPDPGIESHIFYMNSLTPNVKMKHFLLRISCELQQQPRSVRARYCEESSWVPGDGSRARRRMLHEARRGNPVVFKLQSSLVSWHSCPLFGTCWCSRSCTLSVPPPPPPPPPLLLPERREREKRSRAATVAVLTVAAVAAALEKGLDTRLVAAERTPAAAAGAGGRGYRSQERRSCGMSRTPCWTGRGR